MFKFENYYAVDNSFMGGLSPSECDSIYQASYPSFYLPSRSLCAEKIRLLLKRVSLIGNSEYKSAATLIRSIYRSTFSLSANRLLYQECQELLTVIKLFGRNIIAHGVEEEKGGLGTLLLIAISGYIRVKKESWGILYEGMPCFSPLSHGPYFIIYTTQSTHNFPPDNCSLDNIESILIPFPHQIILLTNLVSRMEADGLLTSTEKESFLNKLIDYKSFATEIIERKKLTL
jgi:hypothetical protein